MVALNLLPLGTIGAVEANGVVSFGLWLPWVSAADGNAVAVKIIHEDDQFLQDVPPREFVLTHSVRGPYGDFWSGTLPIAGTAPAVPGSTWGTPGRYVYRYSIRNPNVGTLDWIIDPFAREFGVGKLSAFTLGYQPYVWSAGEAQWRRAWQRSRSSAKRCGLPEGSRRQSGRDHAVVECRQLGGLGFSNARVFRRR